MSVLTHMRNAICARLELKVLIRLLSRYPHLQDLFAEVVAGTDFSVGEEVTDQKAIASILNRLVKKRAWYYWFGAISFYKSEQYKKPYKQEDYFAVSVHEIVEQINASSDTFIDQIQQKITIYLEQELHQQVNNFFVQLDQYLSNYLQSLQQAQSDHKLSLEQRDTLSNSLSRLVPQTTNYINQTNNYLAKTQQILKG